DARPRHRPRRPRPAAGAGAGQAGGGRAAGRAGQFPGRAVVRRARARPGRRRRVAVPVRVPGPGPASRSGGRRLPEPVPVGRDGLLLLDDWGVVRYATPAARPAYGCDSAAVTGTDFFELIHPDDRDRAREWFARALARPGEDVPHTTRVAAGDPARAVELSA